MCVCVRQGSWSKLLNLWEDESFDPQQSSITSQNLGQPSCAAPGGNASEPRPQNHGEASALQNQAGGCRGPRSTAPLRPAGFLPKGTSSRVSAGSDLCPQALSVGAQQRALMLGQTADQLSMTEQARCYLEPRWAGPPVGGASESGQVMIEANKTCEQK